MIEMGVLDIRTYALDRLPPVSSFLQLYLIRHYWVDNRAACLSAYDNFTPFTHTSLDTRIVLRLLFINVLRSKHCFKVSLWSRSL